ncbi:TMEM175 family protein [Puerhibacterium puerhi]|uniref:TMEM175 family protein n=1 Tax=Puerhibacterium puerhi TaxID=2692623 RepID=UPI00135871A6|nr:TMEM175 family protein [Puerhibacterium puerhi]
MAEPEPVRRRGDAHGLDRVLAFADAVAAIALTLVMLPLVDQAMAASSAQGFFADSWPDIVSAAISFAVIGIFWHEHHWLFVRATGYSPRILQIELFWLASIVALPVATVLDVVVAADDDRLALGVYVGTMLFGSLCLHAEETALRRGGFLPTVAREGPFERWLVSGLFGLAFVLALLFPGAGAAWLLVLLLERPLRAAAERRRRAAGRQPA